MDTIGYMDVAGGNISGEVFILRSYWDWVGGEIHIYYSSDYGESWIHYSHLVTIISEINQTEAVKNYLMNSPNPCNSNTIFKYSIPKDAWISLAIYDIYGSKIKTLFNNKNFKLGEYQVFWDCKDEEGYPVSSGIYFSVLGIENSTITNKVIILK
ncbi:T9SS type A sorting domain-containing protein [bacterium]|nr:T9SS type A sorting domain-containing protein [bacterium]